MQNQTNEAALERAIEKRLTGTCQEELRAQNVSPGQVAEPSVAFRGGHGYWVGAAADFNAAFAVDEARLFHFLENTQADELAKLQKQPDWRRKILEKIDRTLKKYGLLRLLRKVLQIDDAELVLFYSPPDGASGKAVRENFERNEFSVTRQVRYSVANPREEVDMVLFVNGLPFATVELKNHWTGQTAAVHGQNQYQKRDEKQPLLQFARCLVHFAVDTDEAYMTTRLDGKDTTFLPFNLGHNFGKGNPPNAFGHKTNYLWDEVLTRTSVAGIIQHFVLLEGKDTEPLARRTLIFPRYHQLDVVRSLLRHARENGVGHTYLIQHSAGSGKSNSITWAAYQLIEVHPAHENVRGGRGLGRPLFDSVIVVTDRRLLDKQLRENIRDFSEVKNIVAPAFSSKELKENLESGKRIIITTIQKFPFIIDGIADLSDKRFAVIIDEAHSSQSGSAADNMNKAMGKTDSPEDETPDPQDLVLEAMRARKMRDNASYLAFTATPKNATLEKFGQKTEDGKFKPFHLYSMKQAIEEGFILDVLANYTTYRSYYEIEKSIEDNPLFDTARAQKKLKKYVEGHAQTIGTKAEIMLDHFMSKVFAAKKLKGKGKAMVVTQSIEAAIRYYFALREILKKKGDPFKIAVAFSGKKTLDGIEHTEDSLNGFAEKDTRDKFDEDEYRILVVANKYLTGFDQPKLCAMYVDKKLQGVLAVQALSRLNRSASKLGKRVEDLFVLDFYNATDDIKAAFDPFYTATTLSQATDVNVLHEIKGHLDDAGVYEWAEVEGFVELFFQKAPGDQLSALIDKAAERFNHELEWTDDDKADFKIKAKQFVKIYGQVAAILDFQVAKWEQLFWFLKFLIPKLLIVDPTKDALDELLNAVDLSTYGLERVKLNEHIGLDAAETELDPQNPNPRGAHGGTEEMDELDLIVRAFNERWFPLPGTSSEDRLVIVVGMAKKFAAHPDFETKVANNPDFQTKELAILKIMDELVTMQRKLNVDFYKLYTQDHAFKQAFVDTMRRMARV
jgi:type I restriction enzyme R subunit